jgi:hypothetical protein
MVRTISRNKELVHRCPVVEHLPRGGICSKTKCKKQTFNPTLQRHNTETNIPRKGIARPQSQFHIHVSVSDLYIPTIGLPILLQKNMWTDPGNIKISDRHMIVDIGNEAVQFLFWEYIDENFVAAHAEPTICLQYKKVSSE